MKLMEGVWSGAAAIVEMRLASNESIDWTARRGGYGPLHWAAKQNDVKVVRLLLAAKGCDVNAQVQGSTALHIGASFGHREAAQALLAAGAETALQNSYGDTALHSAAAAGQLGTSKVLIEAQSELDALNALHMTALDCASRNGHLDVVQLLAERGARRSGQEERLARQFNHIATAAWLAAEPPSATCPSLPPSPPGDSMVRDVSAEL
jgi:ankyrin repeat protein